MPSYHLLCPPTTFWAPLKALTFSFVLCLMLILPTSNPPRHLIVALIGRTKRARQRKWSFSEWQRFIFSFVTFSLFLPTRQFMYVATYSSTFYLPVHLHTHRLPTNSHRTPIPLSILLKTSTVTIPRLHVNKSQCPRQCQMHLISMIPTQIMQWGRQNSKLNSVLLEKSSSNLRHVVLIFWKATTSWVHFLFFHWSTPSLKNTSS